MFLSMKMYRELTAENVADVNFTFPDGVVGVMFVYETANAAYNNEGEDVKLMEVRNNDNGNDSD